ncbi:hypothetical protein BDR26DRAFT_436948 [Obelidium mucronatum]|nr:hypothetical protein BDR26DRAFT_436948 [Obelidium mucronatum]
MAHMLTPSDLHRILVSDIMDMKADILRRTDALLALISTYDRGGIASSNPSSKHYSPQSFGAELSSVTALNQQLQLQHQQNIPDSHLDLGIRWDESDYTADIDINKSIAPSIFRHKVDIRRSPTSGSMAPSTRTSNGPRRGSIFSIMNSFNAIEQPIPILRKPETREGSLASGLNLQASNGKLQLPGRSATKMSRSNSRIRNPSSLSRSRTVASNATNQPASIRSSVGARPASSAVNAVKKEDFPINLQEKRSSVLTSSIMASGSLGRSSDVNKVKESSSADALDASALKITDDAFLSDIPRDQQESQQINQQKLPTTLKIKTQLRQLQTISSKNTLEGTSYSSVGMASRSLAGGETQSSGVSISRVPIKDAENGQTKAAGTSDHHIVMNSTGDTGSEPPDTTSGGYNRILFYFLVPAFDNKGGILTLDQFDQSDFDDITFKENGLHPKSVFSTVWDFIMSIFYSAVLWLVPFYIGYEENIPHSIFIPVALIFSVDSLITFVTPQPQALINKICSFREYESMRPNISQWIFSWLKYQLFIDALSIIPFEIILEKIPEAKWLSLFHLLRMYRLPSMMSRCAIFKRCRTKLEGKMGMGISTVIPIAIVIFYFIHVNACFMYLIGKSTGFIGWSAVWFEANTANLVDTYIWTIFQAVGNLFPMSFKPQTPAEQLAAIVFIVCGAVLYAIFIGSISSAAMSIDSSGRLYNQKMEELVDYVKFKNLSEETKEKLISYYETKYRGKYFEEENLLADMNESLRTEILHQNTRSLIEKVPFLRRSQQDGRDEIFYNRIATVLRARYFIPGDLITIQGDSGSEMFFILSGKVHVFVNGHKVVSLYDGAYIGEVALISRVLRTASAQAAMPTVMYRLTFQDFHTIISEFPDMQLRINKLALERERMINHQLKSILHPEK